MFVPFPVFPPWIDRLLGCGSQLRSDDPASLKDIIRLAQEKTKGREQTMT